MPSEVEVQRVYCGYRSLVLGEADTHLFSSSRTLIALSSLFLHPYDIWLFISSSVPCVCCLLELILTSTSMFLLSNVLYSCWLLLSSTDQHLSFRCEVFKHNTVSPSPVVHKVYTLFCISAHFFSSSLSLHTQMVRSHCCSSGSALTDHVSFRHLVELVEKPGI